MSNFATVDANTIKQIGEKLDRLAKSFQAGYQGIQNAGRTGISALAAEQLDPVLRSITLEDKDFLLTKDIPTLKATQSVYQYMVKTAVRSGVDLAGWESFLPQEDTSQYIRVAEVLKVYGIRKSISQMAQLINDAGGYSVDLEKENDLNAALSMAEALERDLYYGGDYFIRSADGQIDATAAANPNGPIRQLRGIQANIREGDGSIRGIPGDFVGYGNNRSVVFDRRGGAMDRAFLDKIVTAVRDSRGAVKEAHCTTSMLAEFRATFFPFERGLLSEAYAIRGAGITNDEHQGLPIDSVGGTIMFYPTVFKYNHSKPRTIVGSVGTPPSTPATPTVAMGGSPAGSGFVVGQVYVYKVQAVNISGISAPATSAAFTVTLADANIEVTIANAANVEYYMVFRTPVEASGTLGKEFFIGKIIPSGAVGSTVFRDNNRVIPGLDSVLFMPTDKNRAKLATLGNLLNKLQLGVKGLAFETIYASYVGCVVDRPRSFALADNLFQQREGL
ncbi:MAG: hypothetical protein QXL01_01315 [Thermoplasmatales archaeon]